MAEASVSLDPVAEWSQIPTNGLTTANSGGSSTAGTFKLELTCWTVGGFASGNANMNWSRNTAVGTVDFANAPTIRLTLAVGNVTTSATIRALMGRTNYTSSAALGEKGYGFEVRTGRLWLVTHDGTALTQSDTGVSLTANTTYVFVFGISEGTLYLRANGVAFSCSGAPTTGTTSYAYLQLSHLSAQATSCTSTWSDLHYSNGVSSALAAGATVGEPPLGNPTSDGMLLSSTAAGVRSWVEAPSGGGNLSTVTQGSELLALGANVGDLAYVTSMSQVAVCIATPSNVFSAWRWWRTSQATAGWRYLRLVMTSIDYLEVLDTRFLVGGSRYPLVNMTSDSAPSPLKATSSDSIGSGFDAYLAFDSGTVSTRWHSTAIQSHWLQLDLGAGNEITPNGFVMTCNLGGGARYPRAIEVRGSNDAFATSDLIAAFPDTGAWTSAVEKTFTW